MTDAITIQNPRNRGGSTGHVLAKRSVTFTEIRTIARLAGLSRQTVAAYKHVLTEVLKPAVVAVLEVVAAPRSDVKYGVHQVSAPRASSVDLITKGLDLEPLDSS